ncbi:NAD(P)H-dependent oxidoreductase, partial [Oharaeibacter diazotrophicus]
MRVHYVHAHGEPEDFGLVLVEAGVAALRAAGHVVEVSDVFGWATGEKHCAEVREPVGSDVLRERRLIAACDVLVLQFPVWWLGLPAGVRHWVDRFLGGVEPARRPAAGGA